MHFQMLTDQMDGAFGANYDINYTALGAFIQLLMDTNHKPHVCSKDTSKRGENSDKANTRISATQGNVSVGQCRASNNKISKIQGQRATLSL